MSYASVLVVDDETAIVNTVRAYLEPEGFTVHAAYDGPTAIKACRAFHPDLVVLDVMLPGVDGNEVLRQVRRESDTYIVMLTAKTNEMDKVISLSIGADDYVAKPFSPRELVARIKAILRRGRSQSDGEPVLAFRRLRIDPNARQVWKDEMPVDLTPIEFDILHALARHRGRVRSREQMLEQLWGYDYYGDERVVDVHIARIRKKIEDCADQPMLVVTVRGAGYRFEDEPICCH